MQKKNTIFLLFDGNEVTAGLNVEPNTVAPNSKDKTNRQLNSMQIMQNTLN